MNNILIDSGFIFTLYYERDDRHSDAEQFFISHFQGSTNKLLIAWPILYESISTRFVKTQAQVRGLMHDWKFLSKRRCLELIDESHYRKKAMDGIFDEIKRPHGHYIALSLVDRVIREILSDRNFKIHYFKTYNQGDFTDISKKFNVIML
jgi:hypothetical protein